MFGNIKALIEAEAALRSSSTLYGVLGRLGDELSEEAQRVIREVAEEEMAFHRKVKAQVKKVL